MGDLSEVVSSVYDACVKPIARGILIPFSITNMAQWYVREMGPNLLNPRIRETAKQAAGYKNRGEEVPQEIQSAYNQALEDHFKACMKAASVGLGISVHVGAAIFGIGAAVSQPEVAAWGYAVALAATNAVDYARNRVIPELRQHT